MKSFKDLKFKTIDSEHVTGVTTSLHFKNGYGISVICHSFSYGGNRGLYEIAVLDSQGRLTYDTPVTDDVIGFLTENEVSEIMEEIQRLPSVNGWNKSFKTLFNNLNNFVSNLFKQIK